MDFGWSDDELALRLEAGRAARPAVESHGRLDDSWINDFSKDFAQGLAALGWIGVPGRSSSVVPGGLRSIANVFASRSAGA